MWLLEPSDLSVRDVRDVRTTRQTSADVNSHVTAALKAEGGVMLGVKVSMGGDEVNC